MSLEELIAPLNYEEALHTLLKVAREEVEGAFDRVRRLLCVQPHPDDVDIAAGGTVAKLASKGVEVFYATLTDGRLGTTDSRTPPDELARIRRTEQEEAARILGVKGVYWFSVRDGELQPTLELRWELVKLIRKLKPDMVMAPDPWLSYEAHPDHRSAGLLASEAVLFAPLPHAAPCEGVGPHHVRYIAYYWTRRPNTFVDVSEYVETKLRAVRAHMSQFSSALEDFLRAYMRLTGKRVGATYAEEFKVLSPLHLHCITFAEDL